MAVACGFVFHYVVASGARAQLVTEMCIKHGGKKTYHLGVLN